MFKALSFSGLFPFQGSFADMQGSFADMYGSFADVLCMSHVLERYIACLKKRKSFI